MPIVYALSLLLDSFTLFLSLVRSLYIIISLSDKVTVENMVKTLQKKPNFQVAADWNSKDCLHLSHYFRSRDKMCHLTST